ncbi:hypothetical protein DUI87_15883 [Hirundo rustica rustica]|uniref:Uncharacterized protein n=1 Tax=Hirundo rustica rustica TaxID=333673 RepID=A0A3M0JZN7_HIRRU|nr:hypothetical protein DUI87_15883 [Hirundo rustica rustica]
MNVSISQVFKLRIAIHSHVKLLSIQRQTSKRPSAINLALKKLIFTENFVIFDYVLNLNLNELCLTTASDSICLCCTAVAPNDIFRIFFAITSSALKASIWTLLKPQPVAPPLVLLVNTAGPLRDDLTFSPVPPSCEGEDELIPAAPRRRVLVAGSVSAPGRRQPLAGSDLHSDKMFPVQMGTQVIFTCWLGFSAAAGLNSVMTAAAVEKDGSQLSRLKDVYSGPAAGSQQLVQISGQRGQRPRAESRAERI